MTSSVKSVVVWEWMNEYGRWRPYDPHIANFIESSYRKSPSVQVNLGNVTPNMGIYSIDFLTMCQVRFGTGTARPVRRQLYPDTSPPGKGIIWQWEGDNRGQWNSFDMEVACLLEEHFSNPANRNKELNLTKTAVKLPYIMDFSNMTQKRIETGRLRMIRRELLPMPYLNSSPSDGIPSSSATVNGPTSRTVNCQFSGQSTTNSQPSSSSSTNGQLSGTSTLNGPSCAKRQRVSGNGQFISNPVSSNTAGPLTRKRLYTHMTQNSAPPTSGHLNSLSQIHTNQTTHPVPQSQQLSNQSSQSMQVPQTLTNHNSQSMQIPQNLTNQMPVPSGILASGFVPHSSAFQRAVNFLHSNISQNSSLPIHSHISARMGLSGGGSSNVTYHNMHSLNSQSVGGSNSSAGMTSSGANVLTYPPNSLAPHGPPSADPTTSGASGGDAGFYLPPKDNIPNNVAKQTIHSTGTWAGCEVFENYVSILDSPPDDEDCCICCEKLTHPSGYGEGKADEKVVFKLRKCAHMFHKLCILAMYESTTKNGSVQCPTCKTIYGEKHGNCPDGVMEYLTLPHSLPGHEGHQTKIIIYHIAPGIQGPEHPHPGKRYTCRGFPRVCYLPDSEKGRKVLKLLIVAWKRRLTFTIGHSTTTGESDTVTWNEIHHKTESGRNHSGHGYPDDKYLDNVLMELNVQGVTEADLKS
ncbi:E3 ubiquitin-protein ligase DTX1-like [Saccostrea cucullata]|uniref:E3 ubiquitin-protein ligase DTX1-like n=1 Tax=Saccostrea cuccullata TaxID=36930 RepID=UPI002ED3704D